MTAERTVVETYGSFRWEGGGGPKLNMRPEVRWAEITSQAETGNTVSLRCGEDPRSKAS